MKRVTIDIEDYLYEFYRKVGENAGKRSAETVMSDVLFKVAGELSADILKRKGKTGRNS